MFAGRLYFNMCALSAFSISFPGGTSSPFMYHINCRFDRIHATCIMRNLCTCYNIMVQANLQYLCFNRALDFEGLVLFCRDTDYDFSIAENCRPARA